MEDLTIRPARLEEAIAIADVYLRSRRASIPGIPPSVHSDEEVHQYFAERMLPHRETWVAELDGVLIGLLVLHDEWVDHLYLEPGFNGRGIGSALLDLAKERRPDGLVLWAFQANTGARRFYERHGFTAEAMTDGDNEEGAPDVRYRWPGVTDSS